MGGRITCTLTTKHCSVLQPMVRRMSATPSKSVSLLHSLPFPISGWGHCSCKPHCNFSNNDTRTNSHNNGIPQLHGSHNILPPDSHGLQPGRDLRTDTQTCHLQHNQQDKLHKEKIPLCSHIPSTRYSLHWHVGTHSDPHKSRGMRHRLLVRDVRLAQHSPLNSWKNCMHELHCLYNYSDPLWD